MNNPYVRLIVILGIPLLIGLGVGYAVRPSGIEPAHAQEHTAAQILPAAPAQQEKLAQASEFHYSRCLQNKPDCCRY
jgi:hypothetical protein